jgi:hypothetical protein
MIIKRDKNGVMDQDIGRNFKNFSIKISDSKWWQK